MQGVVDPVIEKAISFYGKEKQSIKAIEELSELIQAVSKVLVLNKFNPEIASTQSANIAEEIADCYIMLEQLKVIYTRGRYDIDTIVNVKLARLNKRIEEHERATVTE